MAVSAFLFTTLIDAIVDEDYEIGRTYSSTGKHAPFARDYGFLTPYVRAFQESVNVINIMLIRWRRG
jgi:hypothetical protein